jgi:hypothetical protein
MDIKNIFKFKKSELGLKKTGQKIGTFWLAHQLLLFITFVFLAAAAGGYYWYKFQFFSDWSAEQKQEYANTQGRDINLKEDEFRKMLDDIANRQKIFKSEHQTAKDIFKTY